MLASVRNIFWLLSVVFLLTACSRNYRPVAVQTKDYRVNRAPGATDPLSLLLKPYADSVHRSMDAVLGMATVPLERKKPESTLGNWMADVLRSTAAEKYDTVVDAAFLNYGSIRLPALPAGEITLGKIYELCPFDNTMVLMRLTGVQLKSFVDIQAAAGGWPCSGVNYQIRDNRVRDLRVGGKPVSDTIIYSLATLDYVANGGDQCGLLRPLPRKDRGLLFRDALIARLAELHRQGRKLESKLENRVTYAQ